MTKKQPKTTGRAPVNGLDMYYEIEGDGAPLVYIPSVLTVVGMKSFPALAEVRSVLTMDLQGHGRTPDLPDRPHSLEQCARDVVELLRHLRISKADFFGESYGGTVATLIAIHNPELVGRVATYGATFGPPHVAHNPSMLRFDEPPTPDSRAFEFQREAYRKVAPTPEAWPQLWMKVANIQWDGLSESALASVKAPFLIALGDRDFVPVKHAEETRKLIPNGELAVIPDAGHFALFSEPERVTALVKHFLEKPAKRPPVATAGMGIRPAETR